MSGAEFWTGGANICLRPARFRSGGRSSPIEPGQALHVVGEIGEADLGGGPGLQPPTVDPPPRRLLSGAEAHSDERSSSGNADSLKTDMETMKLEWHAFMR